MFACTKCNFLAHKVSLQRDNFAVRKSFFLFMFRIFCDSGQDFNVALQFSVLGCWETQFGLILERQVMQHQGGESAPPHGSAFIFRSGSGSAFSMRNRIQGEKNFKGKLKKSIENCQTILIAILFNFLSKFAQAPQSFGQSFMLFFNYRKLSLRLFFQRFLIWIRIRI